MMKSRHFNLFYFALLTLIFSTSSMDLFFNFSFGGFSIRLSHLLIIILDLIFIINILIKKEIFLLPSFEILLLWGFLMFLFGANSLLILRGAGYGIWLLTLILWCIASSNFALYYSDSILKFVLFLYIISFLPSVVFGLLQFYVPTFMFSNSFLFKTQGALSFFKYYSIHRINGFNYEPSYYATYLVPLLPVLWSWIKTTLKIERVFGILFLIIGIITIFLSTSRMGWIGISLFFVWVIFVELIYFLRKHLNRNGIKILISILVIFLLTSITIFFISPLS